MFNIFTANEIAIAEETKNKALAIIQYLVVAQFKKITEKPAEWLLIFLVRGKPQKLAVTIYKKPSLILFQPFEYYVSLKHEEVKGHDATIAMLFNRPVPKKPIDLIVSTLDRRII